MKFRLFLTMMILGLLVVGCASGEGSPDVSQTEGDTTGSEQMPTSGETADQDAPDEEASALGEDVSVSATITAKIDGQEHKWKALIFDTPEGAINSAYWGAVTVGDEKRTQATIVATELSDEGEELSTLRITFAFEPGSRQAGFEMPGPSSEGKLEYRTAEGSLYKLMRGELTTTSLEAVQGEPARFEGAFQGELVFFRDGLFIEPGSTMQLEDGRFLIEEAKYAE